ncbi:MAG: putative bifunctional diguanylate cyclase/phosphodiesterase [Acidiferrobacteraceae bacterium]
MTLLFASRDPLTGLMDRASLHRALEKELSDSARLATPCGLLLFDIDRFKLINCGFGDQHGDAVLREIAHLAEAALRPTDRIGRWAGQQFLCILPCTGPDTTDAIAEQLRTRIERHAVTVGFRKLEVTASFGVACFPQDGRFARRLLAAVEAALYQAKDSGRNRIAHASTVQQRIFGVGNLLDKALRDNRIIPTFQPIVDLGSGRVVGEESLARLITPEGRLIEASKFITISQQLQLTYKIDRAIITHTFERCRASATRTPPMTHFVNVSGNLLRHPDVLAELLRLVHEYRASCEGAGRHMQPLVIEITEREFLGDVRKAQEILQPFVDAGVQLALDDFGSGYSSFLYLTDLPFSFIKIEGTLIARIAEPKVRAIVQGIQKIACDLGLVTLAEGVENPTVARLVTEIGIDWGQGYYFDEAMPLAKSR